MVATWIEREKKIGGDSSNRATEIAIGGDYAKLFCEYHRT
jgi:hypothetical protein